MGGWKPAKKEAQREIQARRTLQMRYTDICNRIHTCYNKIADYNDRKINEELRPETSKDVDTWLKYWEDELWIAINYKEELRLEAEKLQEEIINPSRN